MAPNVGTQLGSSHSRCRDIKLAARVSSLCMNVHGFLARPPLRHSRPMWPQIWYFVMYHQAQLRLPSSPRCIALCFLLQDDMNFDIYSKPIPSINGYSTVSRLPGLITATTDSYGDLQSLRLDWDDCERFRSHLSWTLVTLIHSVSLFSAYCDSLPKSQALLKTGKYKKRRNPELFLTSLWIPGR